jgi:[DsrC]-trisulfide reductase subunit M
MSALVSLLAVVGLSLLAFFGQAAPGMGVVFGVVVPYIAIVTFLAGFVYRVLLWAKAPVPFRITTTCGQQKSLPWIKSSPLDSPHSTLGVVARMALEVLCFRSRFRNTKAEIKAGGNLVHGSDKFLWAAGLAFHYSFLVVFLRHLRFFTEPVPSCLLFLQSMDGFFQVGLPVFYTSSFVLLGAATFLFLRRVLIPQVRYISLLQDFFPLFLIIGIAVTGLLMRHTLPRMDIVGVKEMAVGWLSFRPVVAEGVGGLFYAHIFLVCFLFSYFPFSKLMHMGGVFLSPTRNMANDNRMKRHVNPWDYPVKVHTYEEYEDEFRDKMKWAGIPVDKE